MKISVIIPAYNHEHYVADAIDSVLKQGWREFELIVINDGSTDATEQRILSFHDPRIRYVSQENSGAHAALNRGIAMAEGEYLSILNSDDVYLPNRLETCLAFLEDHPDYATVLSTVEGIHSDGTPVRDRMTPEVRSWLDWYREALPFFDGDVFYPNAFAKNILITTSNLFARRSCFREGGGFKALRYAHDWDMLLRLAKRYRIHLIRENLLQYRMHPENTVHEQESDLRVRFEVNWLVVDHLKGLSKDLPFPDVLNLLKQNHHLYFETMLFLSMMKDEPGFHDLIDFSHPQTIQFLELLQQGIGIKTSFALQARVRELEGWVRELQEGKAWLASQCEAWEKAADEHEQIIASLGVQIRDLQGWVQNLQDFIQEMRRGQDWLKSQCEDWEKASAEQGRAVAELSSRLQEMNDRLRRLQSHIGVRIVNRLTGRKLF